jgi:hypothetical protein
MTTDKTFALKTPADKAEARTLVSGKTVKPAAPRLPAVFWPGTK